MRCSAHCEEVLTGTTFCTNSGTSGAPGSCLRSDPLKVRQLKKSRSPTKQFQTSWEYFLCWIHLGIHDKRSPRRSTCTITISSFISESLNHSRILKRPRGRMNVCVCVPVHALVLTTEGREGRGRQGQKG